MERQWFRRKQDVSVWRPRKIGMTAKNGLDVTTLVIRAGGRDSPPERFDLVWWQERGVVASGAGDLSHQRGVTWRRRDKRKPPHTRTWPRVALACLSPNRQPLGGQIWNDRGGGAPKDAAFFEQPEVLFRYSDLPRTTSHGASSPFLRELRQLPGK